LEEARGLADDLDFEGKRWVVKVRQRLVRQELLGPFAGMKGFWVGSSDELLSVCASSLRYDSSPPLVQEEIPGPPNRTIGFNVILGREGVPLVWITKRKHRATPYDFGPGAMWETCPAPQVVPLALRFIRASGGFGLLGIEFKEDPRDGVPKLIECNCRAILNTTLFRACGVDLVNILHREAVGEDYEIPRRWRRSVRWTSLVDDLTEIIVDSEHYGGFAGRSLDALSMYARTRVWGLLSLRDPLPFMAYAGRRFAKRQLRSQPR
jgi:predicted ATP-grasp superfamily ATP-dependent carboligase